jgi:hypothetical protein
MSALLVFVCWNAIGATLIFLMVRKAMIKSGLLLPESATFD